MRRILTIATLFTLALPALPAAAEPAPAPDAFWVQRTGTGAFLGVQMKDLDDEAVERFGVAGRGGVEIQEVFDGTPAAEAGLREGDVLLAFDGERVRSSAHLARLVSESAVDRTVRLEVLRGNSELTLEATLRKRESEGLFGLAPAAPMPPMPSMPAMPAMPHFAPDADARAALEYALHLGGAARWRIGFVGEDLGGQLAEYFDVDQGEGVLVKEVVAGSAAEAAGLRAGDVLVGLDDERIGSLAELRELLAAEGRDAAAALVIVRKGRERSLPIEMTKVERPEGALFGDSAQWREQAEQYREQAEQWREQQRAWREQAQERAREMREQQREFERRLREEAREMQRQSRPAPQPNRFFAPQPIATPAPAPAAPSRVPSEPLHY